jgi:hypothetical protein
VCSGEVSLEEVTDSLRSSRHACRLDSSLLVEDVHRSHPPNRNFFREEPALDPLRCPGICHQIPQRLKTHSVEQMKIYILEQNSHQSWT